MEISVVIPVYNAEEYIESAVDSALKQKETAEVILVEDCSPDNALQICERLANTHARVQLYRHPNGENRGAGESRNLGIRKARFRTIAFLDADDYYLENCFSKAVEIFNNDATVDGVYSAAGAEFENEESRRRYFLTHKDEMAAVDEHVEPEDLFEKLITGGAGYIHLNALVVKKSALEEIGLFPDLRLHQDMVLTVKLAALSKLVAGDVKNPVSIRRLHMDNRITNLKTNFFKSSFLANQHLYRWAKEIKLDRAKQTIVRKRYWRRCLQYYKSTISYPQAFYYFSMLRLSRLFST